MKTISLRITGKCETPANDWHWSIAGSRFMIPVGQQKFEHSLEVPLLDGWNSVHIEHTTEDHHRLHQHGHTYSYVNVTGVYLDGVFCRNSLLLSSGLTAYSKTTNGKTLYLNNLAEPFDLVLKFFHPLKHWQFALSYPTGHSLTKRYDQG